MRQQLGAGTSRYLERVPHALGADVQLWRVDLDAYAGAVALEGLTADEHARAARFGLGRDGQRYLAARHALRRLLAEALDRAPQDVVLEPDEFGKLHLVPRGSLHFNLSHSAHESLIGISRDRPIGVDVEVVHEVIDAEALVETLFTAGERAAWSRAAPALRDRTFLACWTRKEACLKALGVGLSERLGSIEVGCDPDLRVVTIAAGARGSAVTLQSLDWPCASVAAVAVLRG